MFARTCLRVPVNAELASTDMMKVYLINTLQLIPGQPSVVCRRVRSFACSHHIWRLCFLVLPLIITVCPGVQAMAGTKETAVNLHAPFAQR